MSLSEREAVCLQCQKCCKREGFVYVDWSSLAEIAHFLNTSQEEVLDQYCDLDPSRKLIFKSKEDHSCIFLSHEGCRIYPVRPLRCQTYPEGWSPEEQGPDCLLRKTKTNT